MGVILYIAAYILFIPLNILNVLAVLWKKAKTKSFFKTLDGYFFSGAVDIDRFANHHFRTLWNAVLKKSGGYDFGNPNETISSAIGKNKRDNTLSVIGLGLSALLDFLDKNHSIKSINENII